MEINEDRWSLRKRRSWIRIWRDLEIGYLDRDLLPLLVLINRDRELYTTSSCSGRIVMVDGEYPWLRDETSIVFKSHIPVDESEILEIYKIKPYKRLWMIVNGPIIHIYSMTLRKAVKIIKAAWRVGFKHSGVLHASKDRGIFVELISGIYISQLLRTRDSEITSQSEVKDLVDLFNTALIEGKKRLDNLYRELSLYLPKETDNYVENELKTRAIQLARSPIEVFWELTKEKYDNKRFI